MMTQKEFDPRKEVLLEETPPSLTLPSPSQRLFRAGGIEGGEKGGGEVEIISEKNNRLQLRVSSKENRLLVLSDTYYPGWKALVDGSPQKIYRANYAFRAVPLVAGTHQVEFIYNPMSFKLGAGVTLLGILGSVGIGLFLRRKRTAQ